MNGKLVKLTWESINKEIKDRSIIHVSLYRLLENRYCKKILISFLDEITGLIDKGNGVGVINLDIHRCMWLRYLNMFHHWPLTASSPPLPSFPVTSSTGTVAITWVGRSGDGTFPHSRIMCDIQILAVSTQWKKDISSWVCVKQAPVQDLIDDGIYWQNLNMLVLSTHTHSFLEFIHHTVTCTKMCAFRWSGWDDLYVSQWTRNIKY